MLYDPTRHEALSGDAWGDDAALACIKRIAADTLAAFSPQTLWPNHPLDLGEGEIDTPRANIYFGAGGVIWALERLRRLGAVHFDQDFGDTVATLLTRNRSFTDAWGHGQHSWLMGEPGLLLLQWQYRPSADLADALFTVVESNLHHPALEALLGSPGSMLAAMFMAEATGEERWRALFHQAVQIVWDSMVFDEGLGAWLWTQNLYGKQRQFLGAGHGFAGNVFPALRGRQLLPVALVQGFAERAQATLTRTAHHEQDQANWKVAFDAASTLPARFLVQDCHGAPGIICRLGDAPAGPALDELLLAGGETVWAAGPLAKGAGLCHGTAGNGYALLKLHQRSGDAQWLQRARAFAMYAANQCEQMALHHGRRRFSLWGGDLGVALFLQSCRDADAAFPTLDVF